MFDFDCFQMIDFNDVYMLQEDENALAISLQLVSLVMPASDSWKATLQVWSQVSQQQILQAHQDYSNDPQPDQSNPADSRYFFESI